MPLGIVWMAGAGCAGARSLPWRKVTSRVADAALDATEGRNETPRAETRRAEQCPVRRSRRRGSERKRRRLPRDRGKPVTDEQPLSAGISRAYFRSVAASAEDEAIANWNRGGTLAGEAPPRPSGKVPHPAPRIKVDVLKITGRINEADVLRQARSKGYWPFRLCYEEGLRRSQKVHGTINVPDEHRCQRSGPKRQKVAAEVDDPDGRSAAS